MRPLTWAVLGLANIAAAVPVESSNEPAPRGRQVLGQADASPSEVSRDELFELLASADDGRILADIEDVYGDDFDLEDVLDTLGNADPDFGLDRNNEWRWPFRRKTWSERQKDKIKGAWKKFHRFMKSKVWKPIHRHWSSPLSWEDDDPVDDCCPVDGEMLPYEKRTEKEVVEGQVRGLAFQKQMAVLKLAGVLAAIIDKNENVPENTHAGILGPRRWAEESAPPASGEFEAQRDNVEKEVKGIVERLIDIYNEMPHIGISSYPLVLDENEREETPVGHDRISAENTNKEQKLALSTREYNVLAVEPSSELNNGPPSDNPCHPGLPVTWLAANFPALYEEIKACNDGCAEDEAGCPLACNFLAIEGECWTPDTMPNLTDEDLAEAAAAAAAAPAKDGSTDYKATQEQQQADDDEEEEEERHRQRAMGVVPPAKDIIASAAFLPGELGTIDDAYWSAVLADSYPMATAECSRVLEQHLDGRFVGDRDAVEPCLWVWLQSRLRDVARTDLKPLVGMLCRARAYGLLTLDVAGAAAKSGTPAKEKGEKEEKEKREETEDDDEAWVQVLDDELVRVCDAVVQDSYGQAALFAGMCNLFKKKKFDTEHDLAWAIWARCEQEFGAGAGGLEPVKER